MRIPVDNGTAPVVPLLVLPLMSVGSGLAPRVPIEPNGLLLLSLLLTGSNQTKESTDGVE